MTKKGKGCLKSVLTAQLTQINKSHSILKTTNLWNGPNYQITALPTFVKHFDEHSFLTGLRCINGKTCLHSQVFSGSFSTIIEPSIIMSSVLLIPLKNLNYLQAKVGRHRHVNSQPFQRSVVFVVVDGLATRSVKSIFGR